MGAFGRGFLGCFGVLAAIVVAIVLLLVASGLSARSDGDRFDRGEARAEDFTSMCAAATVRLEREYGLRGLEPSLGPPRLVSPGPPANVQCAAIGPRGGVAFEISVICYNELEPDCVVLKGVTYDGRKRRRAR